MSEYQNNEQILSDVNDELPTEQFSEQSPADAGAQKKAPETIFKTLRGQPINGYQPSVDETVNRFLPILLGALALLLLILLITIPAGCNTFFKPGESTAPNGDKIPDQPSESGPSISTPGSHPFADGPIGTVLLEYADENTLSIIEEGTIGSTRATIVDVDAGKIIASRLSGERMYPASMTKIMTLIVAVENLSENVSLSHKINVSKDVYDKMIREGASGMGLAVGEQLTVEALLYMTALQSDGIAATELAKYIAGTEEEFVSLMNRKADSMGLANTHFSNPTGLQDEANYSCTRDMATILDYAMKMTLCRQILTAKNYEAECTSDKGKGKTFTYHVKNNLTVKLLEEDFASSAPTKATITAGKTGWTGKNSGYCLASYAVTADGHAYIVVTSQADSYQNCIKDHAALYDKFVK